MQETRSPQNAPQRVSLRPARTARVIRSPSPQPTPIPMNTRRIPMTAMSVICWNGTLVVTLVGASSGGPE